MSPPLPPAPTPPSPLTAILFFTFRSFLCFPLLLGGKPRVVTTVTVQLSGDRRVVDEALAAQFLQVFRNYLSNPKSMML